MRKHSFCVCTEKQFKVRHLPCNRLCLDTKCQFSPVSLKKCEEPKHKFFKVWYKSCILFPGAFSPENRSSSSFGKETKQDKTKPQNIPVEIKKIIVFY